MFRRSIYIAARNSRAGPSASGVTAPVLPPRLKSTKLKDKVKEVENYAASLKTFINKQNDIRTMQNAMADTDKSPPSESEIESLFDYVSGPQTMLPKKEAGPLRIPDSIAGKLQLPSSGVLSVYSAPVAAEKLVRSLLETDNLSGVPVHDLDTVMSVIPVENRVNYMELLFEQLESAGVKPSKLTFDLAMSAYAHYGVTTTVKAFMEQLIASGFEPTTHTFGHLVKSLSKNKDLEGSVEALKQMQSLGIEPSVPVYTTLLQTCIKVGDFKQATDMFDMLKFYSKQTQPDVKVYNSMILAAGKQGHTEKALDLFREMSQKFDPDPETFKSLIYTCARDSRTQVQAWNYLLELKEMGINDGFVIRLLMYLCGCSGELSMARSIFQQLCATPETFPDSEIFHSLLKAYASWQPHQHSAVMASSVGSRIRTAFIFEEFFQGDDSLSLPFLPQAVLTSRVEALAESRALYQAVCEKFPSLITEECAYEFLKIPANHNNFSEFKFRYNNATVFADAQSATTIYEENSVPELQRARIERNLHIYNLAIDASMISRNLDFAQSVWIERGKWRKSEAYSNLSLNARRNADYVFARGMVNVMGVSGDVKGAIDLLKSTRKQFKWGRMALSPFINYLIELEDNDSLKKVHYLISRSQRRV